jgi:hypothetical protein
MIKTRKEDEFDLKSREAEASASKLIERYGISSAAHIRLKDIAYDLGVGVVEGPLEGAAASLVRTGKRATIRVSIHETYQYRKRFSIAHELGHFVLNHGLPLRLVCSDRDMTEWHRPGQEREANAFAAELILPRVLVERRCDVAEVTLNPVRQISEEFRASLTASAIRFVRFCPEMCAVVFSREGRVKWCFRSRDWWPFIRRDALDRRTLASDFFAGKSLADEPEEVVADAWLDGRGPRELVEHSIAFRNLHAVLTLLWIRL